jgi:hypothetical protein
LQRRSLIKRDFKQLSEKVSLAGSFYFHIASLRQAWFSNPEIKIPQLLREVNRIAFGDPWGEYLAKSDYSLARFTRRVFLFPDCLTQASLVRQSGNKNPPAALIS